MKQYQEDARRALNAAAETKIPMDQYQEGDEPWLETTHLKLPNASKLSPRQVGPFKICKQISPVTYRLQLPLSWTIHNVFHASLLHPYQETTEHRSNFTRPPPDLIED
jgi:hypothetical protein